MKSHKIDDLENQENNNIAMTNIILESSLTNCLSESQNDIIEKESLKDKNRKDIMLSESDFESLPEKTNAISVIILKMQNYIPQLIEKNKIIFKWSFGLVILALYTLFFIWSMICKSRENQLLSIENNYRLIWMSILIYLIVGYNAVRAIMLWKSINMTISKPTRILLEKTFKIIFIVICVLISLVVLGFVIYTAITKQPYNLVSLSGILMLLLFCYIFSTAPHMINWKTVLLGILLQFFFALIILTTDFGFQTFKFLGDRVTEFLKHTEAGCKMVFGDNFAEHYFAFRVLPIIVFLSSIMSILYYLGVIQFLVIVIGTSMQTIMGTTCGESLNAAANIFLGMTESPLLIKPLLGRMTNSELHAIMTGGFATIAGSVLGAYIGYGAPANHLISASVMSAPAALAISKLMCPETKKSRNTKDDIKELPKSPYTNIVEATTAGASDSITLVANIAVNLIAFVAILAFFNATLGWLGDRACFTRKLTFELICSYLFWPLALVMGVYIGDCRKVAELIGVKTFLNEFVAYQKLGILLKNRKIYDSINKTMDTVIFDSENIFINFQNGTKRLLEGGILLENRSVVIATYALCGFANMGSVGILLSSLSAMIPHRRRDLSKLILRAMVAGNVACFLTACIAGLFYSE